MGIYKRDKIWWSRIENGGRVYQRSLKTGNKQEAVNRESAMRTALMRGDFGLISAAQSPTLKDFKKRFTDYVKLHTKGRTAAFYADNYRVLLASPLAGMRLGSIDASAIEQFKAWRMKQDVAVITVNHTIRTLRRILHLAEDWKLLARAPRLKLLPGENMRVAVISDDELQRMTAHAAGAWSRSCFQFLLPFLVDTGLRISEAVNLKKEHLELVDPRPYLRVVAGKTRLATRMVPLTPRAAIAAERATKMSRCDYAFVAAGGRKPLTRSYASQQFRLVADLNNMTDAVLHSTRHTYCTRLGDAGADAFQIQRLAGHSSITISQRYVHIGRDRLFEAVSKLVPKDKTAETPKDEQTI